VSADRGTAGNRLTQIAPRWRLQNNSSYLRVRGETQIAYGLKAIGQVEAEFGIDGELGGPFSGTRNTGVGISHKQFGTLIAGRWDTPMKQTTIGLDPFGGTGIFGYYNTFGSQQVGAGNAANRWDRRATNSLNYTSPSIQGLQVLASGSVGETRLSGAVPVDPYTLSAALWYKSGPLYVGAAYEFRHDCGNPDANDPINTSGPLPSCSASALGTAGANPNGEDQGFRFGAGYANKPTLTKVAVAYEYIDLKTFSRSANATTGVVASATRTYNRHGYWASITQGLGSDKTEAILNWGMADTAHGNALGYGTKSTGAQYFTLALRQWLAKDTDFTIGVSRVDNEKNAGYKFGSNSPGTVPNGSTVLGYGAQLRFVF
jgi:predicted porin